jgi:hypothetical protein
LILVRGQALGKMSQDEVKEFIAWTKTAPPRNLFDPNIIGYPRCAMLMTENGEGNLAYLPCQTVLMAEGFVPKPGSTNRQRAASLGLFDKSLGRIAKSMSVGEVYTYVPFAESDYAFKIMRHGWKEIENVRLFKKPTGVKVGD